MFKKTLLATTALVLGAAVAFASHEKAQPKFMHFVSGGHQVHPFVFSNMSIGTKNNNRTARHVQAQHWTPGATYSSYSKDANAEFISWYGFTAANSAFSSNFGSGEFFRGSSTAQNAVGFTGAGKKIKTVTFAGFGFAPSDEFQAVILSSVGGLPGGAVAHTSSTTLSDTALCCTSSRTVNVAGKHTLTSGTQYFVSVECVNTPCRGGWNFEDTDLTGATVDYYTDRFREQYNFGTGTHTYSGSSPWHASTYYPEAGAVIVK